MRILPFFSGSLFCFWLLTVSLCHGDDNTVEVFGIGECADCSQYKIKTSLAFSGLRVNIDCKTGNEHFKTKGIGVLDEEGKFKVSLPKEMARDGQLKEECYAQLHSASNAPCPAHEGLQSSKIIPSNSNTDGKQYFGLVGKLKFSPVTCTSKFFWSHFNYPPLPNLPHFPHPPLEGFGHHHLFTPPKVFPPPTYKKPLPPHVPVYNKPVPPPVPIYKKPLPPPVSEPKKSCPPKYVSPPVPVYKKHLPPPTPIYKKPLPPQAPKPKKPCAPPKPKDPTPPTTPVYKKPLPPPVPIYKKPLPPPTYKHPFFKHLPSIFHKPHTPIFKHPLLPPVPKFGKIPHVPPFAPHP